MTTKASGDHRAHKINRVNGQNGESPATAEVDSEEAEIEAAADFEQQESIWRRMQSKLQASFKPRNHTSIVIVPPVSEQLEALVSGFRDSDQAKITEAEIHRIHNGEGIHGSREIATNATRLRGYRKASWWTQFQLLSGRAFKNLYRHVSIVFVNRVPR